MKAARTNTERNSDPEGRKHNESVSTYGAPGTRPRTEIHATRNGRHVVHPGKHKAVEIVADSVYFADAKKESAAGSYAESAMTSEGFEVTDEDIPF